jgi:hypothetical protein
MNKIFKKTKNLFILFRVYLRLWMQYHKVICIVLTQHHAHHGKKLIMRMDLLYVGCQILMFIHVIHVIRNFNNGHFRVNIIVEVCESKKKGDIFLCNLTLSIFIFFRMWQCLLQ